MQAHHLQPWLSSKTALAKRLIFAGVTGNLIHCHNVSLMLEECHK